MANAKKQRLATEVMEKVAAILHDMKDPRLQWVSVVHADVSPDLSTARIAISVLADEQADAVLKVLRKAAGHVRSELATRMHTRQVPELTFVRDRSIEYSARVAELLEDIHRGDSDAPS